VTLFELVKIALDELYSQGKKLHGIQLDAEIKGQMKYLAQSYANLTKADRPPVDYKNPATRFAYVYKYVATHGDYVVQILELLRDELGTNIFADKKLRLTCVGGGPGSEIIGVLKYLDKFSSKEPVEKLTCYLLDREQAWADTWTEFDDSFTAHLHVSTNFQPLDVSNPASYASQIKFLDADLFTMSYFVSEVHSLNGGGQVTKFFDTLFTNAKSGALFLYDDNSTPVWTDYFDGLWNSAGLTCLMAQTNVAWTPNYSEQTSDLGEYLEKFDHSPNLKKQLSLRVLRKP
jgi:hypothetical protein